MNIKNGNRDIENLLMHVFSFLLLWEWLRPLTVVTDTESISIFVLFIGMSFLLSYFQVHLAISSIVKVGLILLLVHFRFYEGVFLSSEWFKVFFYQLSVDLSLLFQANWYEMSSVFRTLLFFILLWLMGYLMFYWVIFQKRILLFLILTIIYITVLDTFSPYDAKWAIVRSLMVGFLMISMLYFERLRLSEGLLKSSNVRSRWMIPLVIILASTTVFSFIAPKAEPYWPDPVPYLKGYGKGDGEGSGNGVKKIGYGTNDSQLGGPFLPDDTVVFNVIDEKRHYWRVETKDFYTGKGWEASYKPENRSFNLENDLLTWYESKTETEYIEQATLTINKKYYHLIYPVGLRVVESEPDVFYSVDTFSEKISTLRGTSSVALDKYSVSYDFPTFAVEELKLVKGGIGLEKNPVFMETYTQLPESLPQRVKDLARSITDDKTTRYEKVLDIERYFTENLYTYDTQNVGIPDEDEDYVDQFLFETKSGYCDNYSTSMIVMVRSLGIPARWVKGYTEGEYIQTIDDQRREYEITNNNAHSWVEVYFPEFGWVPFEPTKGFDNPFNFVYDLSKKEEAQQPETPERDETLLPEKDEKKEQLDQSETNSLKNIVQKVKDSFSWKNTLLTLWILLLLSYVAFKTKPKWYPAYAIFRYKKRKKEDTYFKAYNALLKQYEKVGLKRNPGQTLRDYAVYIDKFYGSTDMQALTRSYERAVYRKGSVEKEWLNSVELWENLIKKTSS
ncbi:transglutaminase domain-containing protein [Bacillus timonensis]|nr:transglutaminase domain-containing protein [Bacillus timonensis]